MRVDKKFIKTVREHIGVGWSFKFKGPIPPFIFPLQSL